MTGAAFTPGPWSVFDHYCGRDPETAGDEYAATRLVGLAQFSTVAEVRQGHDDIAGDVDANAYLIAASPMLYEALERMVERYTQLVNCGDCGSWNPEAEPVVIDARAVLAAARGEASK